MLPHMLMMPPKKQWEKSKNLYKNLLSEKDYKNLEESKPINKRFFFNDFYEHNKQGELKKTSFDERFNSDTFFGERINVQAIVGKNGSGKSTLMELIYIAINNFACIFTHLMPRSNFFSLGLYLNLYFNIDSIEYKMKCEETSISLGLRTPVVSNYRPDVLDVINFVEVSGSQAQNIADKFFYTIVSNYAILSFVPSNYRSNCKELCRLHGPLLNNKWLANDSSESWIQRIFHKNDGYTCPIVLNPMRNEGAIDVEKEMQLSKYRILALLIYAKVHNLSFDDRYKLNRVELFFRGDFATEKFNEWEKFKRITDPQEMLGIVDGWLGSDPTSISNIIINHFHLNITKKSIPIKKIALVYLQGKILSLPKYHLYETFRDGGIEDLKLKDIDDVDRTNFKALLDTMSSDSSHVVTKIHQVINFLSIEDENKKIFRDRDLNDPINYFDLYLEEIRNTIKKKKDEWNNFTRDKDGNYFLMPFIHAKPWDGDFVDEERDFSLDEIIECLPPSILEYDIYLYDEMEKKEVLYNRMSSGELQLLQTISTHLYHVRNIMSVNGSRLQYKNINMIFDELELCFHPEYQRIFVKKLVDILKNMKLTDTHSFNIFLITHSPFVLSDLPPERILYLKDGSMDTNVKISTFAGNIGEMFYDSFFLESTIGAFAEEKIKRLIDIRNGLNPNTKSPFTGDEKKEFEKERMEILNKVGDPVLKSLLE
ncbi:AAA family ATPase [Fibrobacter sp. UWH6]|uniref:AAA family ATPase n=2 Tax=unclassified Fibrobacter TaxID=2634177 RepID=UPI00091F7DB1|nr:AAA family ATPase [Fibrobacter sp. UWH6]OWV05084.1 hypothetical protein B7993_08965 [Fibrobacter sp. UWH3]SHL85996.1 AAA ATPase domain-containing protein [Fibrobacter sp. UWH6]